MGHYPLPEPQKILNKNMSESFSLHVITGGDNVYEVFDWRTVAVRPTLRSCSCRKWNITRIPCSHTCAVIRFIQHNVMNYLDGHMKMETFKRTCAPLYPILDFDKLKVSSSGIFPHIRVYVHISGFCPSI